MDIFYITLDITLVTSGHQSFGHQGAFSWKTTFPQTRVGGWFEDDSNTLYLVCMLFLLLLLPLLHLRSSGIRSQRLGTPALSPSKFMLSYTLEV